MPAPAVAAGCVPKPPRPDHDVTRLRNPPSRTRFLVAALALCCAAGAHAQWSGSVTLMSDNRFRGVSLSDGQPDVRAGLGIDLAGGWYAGTSVTRAELWPDHRRPQWLFYGGRSGVWEAGRSWELGATRVHFASAGHYDYSEFYAGLLGPTVQARLYVSPDYFGRGLRSGYLELDGQWSLPLGVRALAHAGALAVSRGTGYDVYARRRRADLRLGLAHSLGEAELQLAWSAAQRGGPYPASYSGRAGGWVLSLSTFF